MNTNANVNMYFKNIDKNSTDYYSNVKNIETKDIVLLKEDVNDSLFHMLYNSCFSDKKIHKRNIEIEDLFTLENIDNSQKELKYFTLYKILIVNQIILIEDNFLFLKVNYYKKNNHENQDINDNEDSFFLLLFEINCLARYKYLNNNFKDINLSNSRNKPLLVIFDNKIVVNNNKFIFCTKEKQIKEFLMYRNENKQTKDIKDKNKTREDLIEERILNRKNNTQKIKVKDGFKEKAPQIKVAKYAIRMGNQNQTTDLIILNNQESKVNDFNNIIDDLSKVEVITLKSLLNILNIQSTLDNLDSNFNNLSSFNSSASGCSVFSYSNALSFDNFFSKAMINPKENSNSSYTNCSNNINYGVKPLDSNNEAIELNNKGNNHLKEGNLKTALYYYSLSIDKNKNKNYFSPYLNKIEVCYRLRYLLSAIKECCYILSIDEFNIKCLYKLSLCLESIETKSSLYKALHYLSLSYDLSCNQKLYEVISQILDSKKRIIYKINNKELIHYNQASLYIEENIILEKYANLYSNDNEINKSKLTPNQQKQDISKIKNFYKNSNFYNKAMTISEGSEKGLALLVNKKVAKGKLLIIEQPLVKLTYNEAEYMIKEYKNNRNSKCQDSQVIIDQDYKFIKQLDDNFIIESMDKELIIQYILSSEVLEYLLHESKLIESLDKKKEINNDECLNNKIYKDLFNNENCIENNDQSTSNKFNCTLKEEILPLLSYDNSCINKSIKERLDSFNKNITKQVELINDISFKLKELESKDSNINTTNPINVEEKSNKKKLINRVYEDREKEGLITEKNKVFSLIFKKLNVLINTNSICSMRNNVLNKEYQELFYGIWLHCSLINHSCIPNSFYFGIGSYLVVKAIADIEDNEEITINYSMIGLYEERNLELNSKWGFTCTCSLCSWEKQLNQEIKHFGNERKLNSKKNDVSFTQINSNEMIILYALIYQSIAEIKELFTDYNIVDYDMLVTYFTKEFNNVMHKEKIIIIDKIEEYLVKFYQNEEKLIEVTPNLYSNSDNYFWYAKLIFLIFMSSVKLYIAKAIIIAGNNNKLVIEKNLFYVESTLSLLYYSYYFSKKYMRREGYDILVRIKSLLDLIQENTNKEFIIENLKIKNGTQNNENNENNHMSYNKFDTYLNNGLNELHQFLFSIDN